MEALWFWTVTGALLYCAAVVLTLGLCKAAACGDRQGLADLEREREP